MAMYAFTIQGDPIENVPTFGGHFEILVESNREQFVIPKGFYSEGSLFRILDMARYSERSLFRISYKAR